jgi:hypothetical protein
MRIHGFPVDVFLFNSLTMLAKEIKIIGIQSTSAEFSMAEIKAVALLF